MKNIIPAIAFMAGLALVTFLMLNLMTYRKVEHRYLEQDCRTKDGVTFCFEGKVEYNRKAHWWEGWRAKDGWVLERVDHLISKERIKDGHQIA